MKDIIIDTFNKYFVNKTIKPIQYDVVKSISNKENALVILPTGYGKSVCYQLPYLLNQDKFVIVISPLISLIKDQKDKLEKMNIPVECFHSDLDNKTKTEMKDNITDINTSEGKIIFLTPEYFNKSENFIKKLVENNRLLLVAIDEAHCISTWGHDFRPDYQEFKIKEWILNIPLIALTATATKKVEEDIIKVLDLKNIKIFKTSFDRPNLFLNVIKKHAKFNNIFNILDKYKDDFTIIYCKTRKKVEEINEILKTNKYNSNIYHAGLTSSERMKIQEDFGNKKINIIVATVAFGMGIDQDIHLVIHWGCPSDMESYYQEIGRAGRDNKESECYLYYETKDYKISRLLIKDIKDNKYKIFKNEQISIMERYCLLPECRRKMLLEHFDEKLKNNYICNKCDNCLIKKNKNDIISNNILYPIFLITHTIYSNKYNVGIKKLILILKGSKSKLINDFINSKTFGNLSMLDDEQIKNLISILIINEYLKEKSISSGFGTVIEGTNKLFKWYNNFNSVIKGDTNLSYDNLYLILDTNKLILNIPNNYINLTKIKFTSTFEELLN